MNEVGFVIIDHSIFTSQIDNGFLHSTQQSLTLSAYTSWLFWLSSDNRSTMNIRNNMCQAFWVETIEPTLVSWSSNEKLLFIRWTHFVSFEFSRWFFSTDPSYIRKGCHTGIQGARYADVACNFVALQHLQNYLGLVDLDSYLLYRPHGTVQCGVHHG